MIALSKRDACIELDVEPEDWIPECDYVLLWCATSLPKMMHVWRGAVCARIWFRDADALRWLQRFDQIETLDRYKPDDLLSELPLLWSSAARQAIKQAQHDGGVELKSHYPEKFSFIQRYSIYESKEEAERRVALATLAKE